MRRLFPLMLILLLLLAACGPEAPMPTQVPVAAPTETATVPAAAAAPAETSAVAVDAPRGEALAAGLPSAEGRLVFGAGQLSSAAAREGAQAELPAANPAAGEFTMPRLESASARVAAAQTNWQIVLDEDFQGADTARWPSSSDEAGSSEIGDGGYIFAVNEGWYSTAHVREASGIADGVISATLTVDGAGVAGVTARYVAADAGNAFYACAVDGQSYFVCFESVEDSLSVLARGEHDAIVPGVENVITLSAVGESLVFSINGEEVTAFEDDSHAEGAWGLIALAGEGDVTATYTGVQVATTAADAPPTATATRTPRAGRTPTAAAATATRTQRPARTPTRTAATATPTAGTTAGDVIIESDFEDGAGTWSTNTGDGWSIEAAGGALVMAAEESGTMVITAPREAANLGDARIEAEVTVEGECSAALMGRFRSSGGDWNLYGCWIDPTGYAGCSKVAGEESGLLDGGETTAVNAGGANHMAMTVQGSEIVFEVNGEILYTVEDEDLTRGAFGLLISSGDAGITASFDDVVISTP